MRLPIEPLDGETLVHIVEEDRAARRGTYVDPLDELGPVDLRTVSDEEIEPEILKRRDGRALLYRASLSTVFGESGTGKGWLALFAASQVLRSGGGVIYLDLEDSPRSFRNRLAKLGVRDDELDRFHYFHPTEGIKERHSRRLVELVAAHGVRLVLLDSLGESLAALGLANNSDDDVAGYMNRVLRPVADAGPSVVVIDHVTKAGDAPLFPTGSQRKRAAVDSAYRADAVRPLAAETGGRVRITCAKDRHGNYPKGDRVADLVASIGPAGTRWELYEPSPDDAPTKGPEPVAAAILDVLDEADGPLSLTEVRARVRKLVDGGASNARITQTLDDLTALGDLEETSGAKRARLFAVKCRPHSPDDTLDESSAESSPGTLL